ncbi:MAG: hypothetical protein HQK57_01605 [Deltaproteobacteria bacterium]|nr:hypothetical protein [Deltaproteobacteria bacterium]MBF0525926.1 hypothetical protein [Deltaproteobacteria bacterium]
MQIPKPTLILSLMVAVSLFMSQSVLADTIYLFGKIGEFPISASMDRKEKDLSGWYFYHSQAKQIRLEGHIDGHGTFRLEETINYKKTGSFEGSVTQGRWAGTWRKTIDAAPLPFYLEENHNQLNNVSANYDCTAKERDAQFHYTYRRKLKLAIAAGVVKAFRSDQGAAPDGYEEEQCSIELAYMKQVASKVGILLQSKGENAEEEAKKCTVRILGDSDILWIRFGDTSQKGDDCRSTDSRIFCSPRIFWNDLILDRRTQKCKALK